MAAEEPRPGKRARVEPAAAEDAPAQPLVSIIVPAHNCAPWLDECLGSVLAQTYPREKLEVSIFEDRSTDGTAEMVRAWCDKLRDAGVACVASGHDGPIADGTAGGATPGASGSAEDAPPGGCGFAKNRAIEQSSGSVLCFLDSDDAMYPDRVRRQVDLLMASNRRCIVGCGFVRVPEDATAHYTEWANGSSAEELWLEQFRECTVLMPTWCLARATFDAVGDFDEADPRTGEAEDLKWFHRFLDAFGAQNRAEGAPSLLRAGGAGDPLLSYRYLSTSGSWRSSRKKLMEIRVRAFERRVLGPGGWPRFAIWGAGRDGRTFYGLLGEGAREKVDCMLDIDPRKIGVPYVNANIRPARKVPVRSFKDLVGTGMPVVVCVAKRRKGAYRDQEGPADTLEANVAALGLVEGETLWYFV